MPPLRPEQALAIPARALRTDPAQALVDAWHIAENSHKRELPFVWQVAPFDEADDILASLGPATRYVTVVSGLRITYEMMDRAMKIDGQD